MLGITTGVVADNDLETYAVAGSLWAHTFSVGADITTFKPTTDSAEAIKVHADTIKAETVLIVQDTGTTLDTLIKAIPTNTELALRTILAADYVVVGDTIAGVTLVTTTTTNSDMRGTDGVSLVIPDAAGTASTLHGTTDGLINGIDDNVWDDGTRSLTILDEDSTTLDLDATYVGGVTVFDEDSTTIDIDGTTLGTVSTLTGHTAQGQDHTTNVNAVKIWTDRAPF